MSIRDEILRFISIKDNYGALLISGKWGSGKTYLLKEIAEEVKRGDEYIIAIISLFGVDSIDILNKRVKVATFSLTSELMNTIVGKENRTKKDKAKYVLSKIKDIHPLLKGLDAALSIDFLDLYEVKKEVECFVSNELKTKELVLVFDDIERSKIDIIELLGFINEFSENREIKTILVADEEQIKKDNLKVDRYTEYKEKVIAKTIAFNPDYQRIIKTIVDEVKTKTEGYKTFLNTNKQLIERLYFDSDKYNFRTLRAVLLEFEYVYEAWISTQVPVAKMANVLYTFGALMFEFKAGQLKKIDSGIYLVNRNDMVRYTLYDEMESYLVSLQKWITTSVWSKSEFIEEITTRFAPQSYRAEHQFLHGNFWNLNQEVFNEGFPIVLQMAYQGELTCDELISFLQKIHASNKYGITFLAKVNYKRIEAGLDKRKEKIKAGEVVEPQRHTFADKEDLDSEAIKIYEIIEGIGDLLYIWENRRAFIQYINQETGNTTFHTKSKRFDYFDKELLNEFVKSYRMADNKRKRELTWDFMGITFEEGDNKEKRTQSHESYLSLIKALEQIQEETDDQFTKAICKSFIDKIKNDKLRMDEAHT